MRVFSFSWETTRNPCKPRIQATNQREAALGIGRQLLGRRRLLNFLGSVRGHFRKHGAFERCKSIPLFELWSRVQQPTISTFCSLRFAICGSSVLARGTSVVCVCVCLGDPQDVWKNPLGVLSTSQQKGMLGCSASSPRLLCDLEGFKCFFHQGRPVASGVTYVGK